MDLQVDCLTESQQERREFKLHKRQIAIRCCATQDAHAHLLPREVRQNDHRGCSTGVDIGSLR
jgi:hypothetical protein